MSCSSYSPRCSYAAIGKPLRLAVFKARDRRTEPRVATVVGVAGDIPSSCLIDGLAEPYVYLPLAQGDAVGSDMTAQMSIVARRRGGTCLFGAMATLVRGIDVIGLGMGLALAVGAGHVLSGFFYGLLAAHVPTLRGTISHRRGGVCRAGRAGCSRGMAARVSGGLSGRQAANATCAGSHRAAVVSFSISRIDA